MDEKIGNDDDVADAVQRIVLHVCATASVESNMHLVQELEAFQRECWELECLREESRRREAARRRREQAERAKQARRELQRRVRIREFERLKFVAAQRAARGRPQLQRQSNISSSTSTSPQHLHVQSSLQQQHSSGAAWRAQTKSCSTSSNTQFSNAANLSSSCGKAQTKQMHLQRVGSTAQAALVDPRIQDGFSEIVESNSIVPTASKASTPTSPAPPMGHLRSSKELCASSSMESSSSQPSSRKVSNEVKCTLDSHSGLRRKAARPPAKGANRVASARSGPRVTASGKGPSGGRAIKSAPLPASPKCGVDFSEKEIRSEATDDLRLERTAAGRRAVAALSSDTMGSNARTVHRQHSRTILEGSNPVGVKGLATAIRSARAPGGNSTALPDKASMTADAALAKRLTELHALQYNAVRHERKQEKKRQARLDRKPTVNGVSLAVALRSMQQAAHATTGSTHGTGSAVDVDIYTKTG